MATNRVEQGAFVAAIMVGIIDGLPATGLPMTGLVARWGCGTTPWVGVIIAACASNWGWNWKGRHSV